MKPWQPYLILSVLFNIHADQISAMHPESLNHTLLALTFGLCSVVFAGMGCLTILRDWRKKP